MSRLYWTRSIVRSFALIGFSSLYVGFVPAAQGQCQTWSTQFDSAHVGGNAIYALSTFDDGTGSKLWVGGEFGALGGVAYVGTWDGQQWAPVCCVPTDGGVYALSPYDAGQGSQMYAGYFTESGFGSIARWTGSGWSVVGGGLTNLAQGGTSVEALAVYDSGNGPELYVGGVFDGSSTVQSKGLIRWNGSAWSYVVSGLASLNGDPPYANVMQVYDAGSGPELYVAGNFYYLGGITSPYVARWNGSQWNTLGSGLNGSVTAMGVWNDGAGAKLYVSGSFTTAGGTPISHTAVWNGSTWAAMQIQPGEPCYAMQPHDDGRGPALFMGLSTTVNGVPTNHISRWDGHQWSALGGGVMGSFGGVYAMAPFDDGSGHGADLYVGGDCLYAGSSSNSSVKLARWYRCDGVIDSLCPGDGTMAACPCGSNGMSGHGCSNSAHASGALMTASGSASPDTLAFVASGELPHSLSILLQGTAPTMAATTFGSGLRCTGGHLLRLFAANASNGSVTIPGQGGFSISARSGALGDPLTTGLVRYYQVYYRDPAAACGSFFNVTNGARIVW